RSTTMSSNESCWLSNQLRSIKYLVPSSVDVASSSTATFCYASILLFSLVCRDVQPAARPAQPLLRPTAHRLRKQPKTGPQRRLQIGGSIRRQRRQRLLHFARAVAKLEQRGLHWRQRGASRQGRCTRAWSAQLAPQLENDSPADSLPNARNGSQRRGIAGLHRARQFRRAEGGEHRECQARPNPGDAEQLQEQGALLLVGKAVERDHVLAQMEIGAQGHRGAGLAAGSQRPPGGEDLEHDAADGDQRRLARQTLEGAAQRRDHRARASRCWKAWA